MAQIIVFKNATNGVSICIPTGELPIEQVMEKDCPAGALIVDETELPEDKDFFNAWILGTTGIVSVDFGKAQELTKNRLRIEREPLLQQQDIAFQRAIEEGADTTLIVAEKQRLRDITNLVDSCETLEELRKLNC